MKNIKTAIKAMPLPQNRYQLFSWLCTGKLRLNPLWQKTGYRLKFFFRTLFLSPRTFCWLEHLAHYPLLGHYLARQTNLPCKLQRPYLASSMSSKARYQALVYHYDFMANRPESYTDAFYGDDAFLLCELSVKNESKIKAVIQSEDKFSREGEVCLYLYDENGIDLATLTFSIIEYQGKSTLFIAGLQGSNSNDARTAIQQATKACYGLFPKRIITEIALILAHNLQLKQVVAVSNQTHVYNNWRYKSRFKHVHSDYDDFWLTLSAQQDEQGLFVLPEQISRKPIEEIASKKRSEYRNRYLLLDNLSAEIHQQLSTLEL